MRNKKLIFIYCLIIFCLLPSYSTENTAVTGKFEQPRNWFKIYYDADGYHRVYALPTSQIDSVYLDYSPSQEYDRLNVNIISSVDQPFRMSINDIDNMVLGSNIPTLYIDTEPLVDEITSKIDYLTANFRFIPYDGTDTINNSVSIRGRGNSSWYFPKKSYRLKFDKKQSIGTLNKAKSFVLISNYIDDTLMRNAIAFKMAELIGMPYAPQFMPVDLIFNGKQRGSYLLVNKIGINAGSIDIDENSGVLWELDTSYDEDFKFRSSNFNLPCMIKDPDFYEICDGDSAKVNQMWTEWKADLKSALDQVYNDKWDEAFDAEQFAKYMLVYCVLQNHELYDPKSMFIYKESKQDKYKMGPVWDFDWGLGYAHDNNKKLILSGVNTYPFFKKIFSQDSFMSLFAELFNDFKTQKLPVLFDFIDQYASSIRDSALHDATIWPEQHYYSGELNERNTLRFDENVQRIKNFISKRIENMNKNQNFMLY